MIPETVLFARIRAAYRVRAVSAAVCVGASVFALGAGVGIPLCLNAAYLAALAALPAAGLTALLIKHCANPKLDRRALARQVCALMSGQMFRDGFAGQKG